MMNLRSGMLRVWAVGSVIWVASFLTVGVVRWVTDPWRDFRIVAPAQGDLTPVTDPLLTMWLNLQFYSWPVMVAFFGPIIALAGGYAVAWVVKGFKSPKAAA